MTDRTAKPKAGDILILMDGKTRVRIAEVSGDMVVVSRAIEPIPITKLSIGPDAKTSGYWHSNVASRPQPRRLLCALEGAHPNGRALEAESARP